MGGEHYKIQSISRLTGWSPELLRAWERRHNLLAPVRTPGGHRLYTSQDLAVLLRIRDELAAGRTIGELAARGRRALLREAGPGPAPAPPAPSEPATVDNLARWTREIVGGAVEVDSDRIEQALDEAYAGLSPALVAHALLRPSAREIGRLWQQGACSVAGEHLASSAFVRRLLRQLDAGRTGRPGPASLVACISGEQHAVAALVVATDLVRAGQQVRYLGAALPASELARAVRALDAPAVYLSSTIPGLLAEQRQELAEVARELGPAVALHLGGQAVPRADALLEDAGVQLHAEPPPAPVPPSAGEQPGPEAHEPGPHGVG